MSVISGGHWSQVTLVYLLNFTVASCMRRLSCTVVETYFSRDYVSTMLFSRSLIIPLSLHCRCHFMSLPCSFCDYVSGIPELNTCVVVSPVVMDCRPVDKYFRSWSHPVGGGLHSLCVLVVSCFCFFSQLPNEFHGHFVTPLEYVISLIRWSLGCVRLPSVLWHCWLGHLTR